MCGKIGCLFRRFHDKHRQSWQDGYTRLLVIGASGMTGSAVIEAAVACVWFKVVAFTRQPDNLMDNKHVKKGNVTVVQGDMLEAASIQHAMENIDVVFFSTSYWDSRDMECEYKQGVNVVQAAHKAGIKHLLYAGTSYSDRDAEVQCKCLAAKEKVQELVLKSGVPCTVIQMSFYFENFASLFKPHVVEPQCYALALPIGNAPLNCGSILDFAHCIAQIILKPTDHIGSVVKLATGHHTLTQIVAWMDRKFPDVSIFDPMISIEEYEEIKYEGSEDICAWFKFLLSPKEAVKLDQTIAYELCPTARSFTSWLDDCEKAILLCLEEGKAEDKMIEVGLTSEMSVTEEMMEMGNKKQVQPKLNLREVEEEKNFERRAVLCDTLHVRYDFMTLWRDLLDSDG